MSAEGYVLATKVLVLDSRNARRNGSASADPKQDVLTSSLEDLVAASRGYCFADTSPRRSVDTRVGLDRHANQFWPRVCPCAPTLGRASHDKVAPTESVVAASPFRAEHFTRASAAPVKTNQFTSGAR